MHGNNALFRFSVNAPAGPSTETLLERLLNVPRLPYAVSCLLLAITLGFPGGLLMRYLDSFDLAKTISMAGIVTGSESYWQAVGFYWIVTYAIFLFYLFYFVRYLRLRLVEAQVKLSPLLPDPEAYNRAFRIVPSRIGALVTSAMVALIFTPSVYRMILTSLGPLSEVHVVISQGMLDFAGGTGIWLYFSSVWSLHKIAKQPMKLKSSVEDPLFGLGPVGSIALALVIVYFGALGVRGLGLFASGVQTTPIAINAAFELVLMVVGLVALAVPINAFHRKMIEQKELETRRLFEQRQSFHNASIEKNSRKRKTQTRKLLMLDIIERRLEKTHTWPFGKGLLGHISTILFSVAAIIIARLITVAMQL